MWFALLHLTERSTSLSRLDHLCSWHQGGCWNWSDTKGLSSLFTSGMFVKRSPCRIHLHPHRNLPQHCCSGAYWQMVQVRTSYSRLRFYAELRKCFLSHSNLSRKMRKAKFIRCGVIKLLVYCPLMFLCLHKEIWQPIVDNNQDLPWSSRLMINSRVYRGEYSQSSISEFEICCLNIHILELCDLFRTIFICVSKFHIVSGYYDSSTNALLFVVMVPSLGGAIDIPRWSAARKGCRLV